MKQAKPQVKSTAAKLAVKPTIRFSSKMLSEAFLALPKSASNKLSLNKGKTTVEGVVNGFPFQAVKIETDNKGNSRIKITKDIYGAAIAKSKGKITVEITRIADEPETRVPADLRKALEVAPKANALWTDITPIARRDWIFWMIMAKQEKTRDIHIKKMCSMLASGKRRVCCFAGINWIMKKR